MRVHYAVTFEFESRPPLTHRGTIAGSSGATCVARATREAQKALRPVGWSSLACTLLERVGTAEVAQDEVEGETAA